MIRTYSELSRFSSFKDRFSYLSLGGTVGIETFGFDRYLNQRFYTSWEWKRVRDYVISRDLGCDLGVEGYEIYDKILVHHMNPISESDITHGNEDILNPEFLITTTHRTHNAIHYGDEQLINITGVDRYPGDTKLW